MHVFLCTDSGQHDDSSSERRLRPISVVQPVVNTEENLDLTEVAETRITRNEQVQEEKAVKRLRAEASRLGFSIKSNQSYEKVFTKALSDRLINRWGRMIYQNVKFPVVNFPREATRKIFHGVQPIVDTRNELTYKLTTVDEVVGTLGPKFAMYLDKRQSGGVTRLCRPPSESVARAAATIMPPFRASYIKSPEGYETLYVTMLYILTDEDGEFHAPKKRSDGIEVALSAALKTRLRVQVLDDIQFLSTRCAPLSPKYWLQLGNPQQAAEIEQGGPTALLTPE